MPRGTAARVEPPSMDEYFQQAQKLWKKLSHDDIMARYDFGEVVDQILHYSERGDGTLGRLAAMLGVSHPLLYQHANVTRAWTKPQIERLIREARRPLTWSILVTIAMEKDDRIRNKMVREVRMRRPTAGMLRQLAHPERAIPEQYATPAALLEVMGKATPRSIAIALDSLIEQATEARDMRRRNGLIREIALLAAKYNYRRGADALN